MSNVILSNEIGSGGDVVCVGGWWWWCVCMGEGECMESVFFSLVHASELRGSDIYVHIASSWKLLRQTTLHLIFALCTGFQSMLESNTNFVLFDLVLSLLLVLTFFPVYSRFTYRLSTVSHTVNALSLTPLQHPTLRNTLPKNLRFSQFVSSFRSALKTHLFPTCLVS